MNKHIALRLGIFISIFYLFSFVSTRILDIGIYEIQDFVLGFGVLAPIVYFIFLFLGLVVPLNPISDFLIINIGVIAFPSYIAIIFTFFAHSAAIIVNYFVGRRYGKIILGKIVNKENSKYIEQYTKKLTIKNLFAIRFVVPIATMFGADVLSYVAGIQRLPFLKYYFVSIVPWTFLSILYFIFSAYLINKSVLLYFLPVVFIVGVPILLVYFFRNKFKR